MPVEKFNLPVGRIVSGNPAVQQTKTNFQTGQAILGKDGQPVQQWRCDIAYPKDVFLREIYPVLQKEALSAYPNWQQLIDAQTGMPLAGSNFAWKFVDGDSPLCPKNSKVPYNVREGYQGCYVLKLSTEAFAPNIYKYEAGAYRTINANEIKCGDYVVACVDIKVHTASDGGLYINPNGFNLVGYGAEIKSSGGPDPTTMFGNNPQYQLPAGASTMPVSSAPVGVAMPMGAPPIMGVPQMGGYAPPQAPQQMPAPAYDLVQAQHAPPVMGVPQMGNQQFPPFAAGVAAVMPQQQPLGVPTAGYAQPATTSHTNGVPPLPQR